MFLIKLIIIYSIITGLIYLIHKVALKEGIERAIVFFSECSEEDFEELIDLMKEVQNESKEILPRI